MQKTYKNLSILTRTPNVLHYLSHSLLHQTQNTSNHQHCPLFLYLPPLNRPNLTSDKLSCAWVTFRTKVLRPGPVQGSGSGFWPGQFFKKKSKRRRFSKKKKQKSTGLSPGLAGSPGRPAGSHRVFPSPVFSSTWPGSGPGSAGSQVDPPGRTGFQNYVSDT